MSAPDNGGPAFPCDVSTGTTRTISDGMTLRDYFAAKAMQGLLAGNAIYDGKADHRRLVADALAHADEMMNARKP